MQDTNHNDDTNDDDDHGEDCDDVEIETCEDTMATAAPTHATTTTTTKTTTTTTSTKTTTTTTTTNDDDDDDEDEGRRTTTMRAAPSRSPMSHELSAVPIWSLVTRNRRVIATSRAIHALQANLAQHADACSHVFDGLASCTPTLLNGADVADHGNEIYVIRRIRPVQWGGRAACEAVKYVGTRVCVLCRIRLGRLYSPARGDDASVSNDEAPEDR
eukprot:9083835-Pyramimonas_sp.AAC.1